MLLPKTSLLTGDSASSKLDPARTLGVAVQDKAQFRKWLGGVSSAKAPAQGSLL